MPKLFLFAIGGTGSRVTKALTMLLASGVQLPNTSEIIPIIVDPHSTNGDLLRTVDLLKTYQSIRSELNNKPTSGFFGTEIKTLRQAVGTKSNLPDTYLFELQGVKQQTFRNYIDYNGLKTDEANEALASLLFSEEDLNTKMDIGFVGHPNIGSVVLNQFRYSDVFKEFAQLFSQDDRIFIISSIFGGTGAAGFPILLKNIRNATAATVKVANSAFLKDAKVGAITIMPYFKVITNNENRVDSNTFIPKTRAALSYYAQNVNDSVNALYYLGHRQSKAYEYDPGDKGQRNDAHLIELVAALAVVDFMSMSDNQLNTKVYKDFGIKADLDTPDLKMPHFADATQKIIGVPLSKMALFSAYLNLKLQTSVTSISRKPSWAQQPPEITSDFLGSSFMSNLKAFDAAFQTWLAEMEKNVPDFKPFHRNTDVLNKVIRGYEPKESGWFGGENEVALNFKGHYDKTLNELVKQSVSPADKFLSLFSEATEKFVTTYFVNLPK